MALSKTDLQSLGELIDQKLVGVNQKLDIVEKDVKVIKKDVKQIKKDVNSTLRYVDQQDKALKKRVDNIELRLNTSPPL